MNNALAQLIREPEFNAREAAELAGVSYDTLRGWLSRGRFQALIPPQGSRALFSEVDIFLIRVTRALIDFNVLPTAPRSLASYFANVYITHVLGAEAAEPVAVFRDEVGEWSIGKMGLVDADAALVLRLDLIADETHARVTAWIEHEKQGDQPKTLGDLIQLQQEKGPSPNDLDEE